MLNSIKYTILTNTKFLTIIGTCSYIFYKIACRVRNRGKANEINIHRTAMFRGGGGISFSGDNNTLHIGAKCRLRGVKIQVSGNRNRILLQEGVLFYEQANIYIEGNNCTIIIGTRSTIGSADIFCGEGDTQIIIGEDCMLSRKIRMNTSDFHSIIDKTTNKRINPPKNISIGNHVWVGNGAFIGKGTEIGEECIVASMAFVTGKKYPGNTILGGVPAKIIKENITWSRAKLPLE